MSGKRLSINISRSRPTIMASKNATGTSINVRQQNDSLTPEISKAMKNVREWKYVEGENKQEYSWFVKYM
jgi:predicted transcriptional regulator